MKKLAKTKYLYLSIIFLLIVVVLISLFIFFRRSNSIQINQTNTSKTDTSRELTFDADDYKNSARELFARLLPANPRVAAEIKQELLSMKVSKDFKDVHFSLVMASVSLEDYSLSGNEDSLAKAQSILSKLQEDYSWLNKESL